MNHVTRCPNCRTAFKVSDTQLAAHGGKVRCGKCAFIFNAKDCLEDGPAQAPVAAPQPAPVAAPAPVVVPGPAAAPAPIVLAPRPAAVAAPVTPKAPVVPTVAASTPPAPKPAASTPVQVPPRIDLRAASTSAAPDAPESNLDEFNAAIEAAYRDALNQIPAQADPARPPAPAAHIGPHTPVKPEARPAPTKPAAAEAAQEESVSEWLQHAYVPAVAALAAEAEALDHDPATAPEAVATVLVPPGQIAGQDKYQPIHTAEDEAYLTLPVERSAWRLLLWPLLLILVVAFLAQAGLRYRTSISTSFPWLRPPLVTLCGVLGCNMPLPRDASLLRSDFSELVFVPDHPSLIQLSASLRNLAPYDQALPSLELTLTNEREEVVAKKVFQPAQYLAANEKKRTAFALNDELHVFLQLDAGALHSSGYTLNWFYP